MTQSIIIEKIYKDKNINEAINNIVNYQYREDFKSFLFEKIYDIKEDKLIDLDQSGELFWYLIRIMTNQWDMRGPTKKSEFWKLYSNNGIELTDNDLVVIDEVEEINMVIVMKDIDKLLDKQHKDWQVNNYHKTLFKMYYYDNKTLKQIERETNIDFNAVSRSLRKTRTWLKKKIIK